VTHPAQPALPPDPAPAGRGVVIAGFAAFTLLGWTSLLVPSLIRDVQAAFGQSDAGMGLAYFLNALLYLAGTMSTGVLAGRIPRRVLLAGGPGFVAVGLAAITIAPAWPVFLLGFLVMGLGLGIIDAGMNALFIDLFSGRAGMLNRLHLFYSLGALAAPLAVGLAISAGLPWPATLVATAVVALPITVAVVSRSMPRTHPHRPEPVEPAPAGPAVVPAPAAAPSHRGPAIPLPLLLLSIAIACYVASELGISSWLVRYLADAPIALATLALSLFWGAMGLSRLVSSFIADRMGAVAFGTTWSLICGAAILAAVVAAPVLPIAIVCFAIAGFAAGPIYPSIMAIGGALHPGRASMVGSTLSSAGMVGSIVYPPLIGMASAAVGLWVGIAGAGVFAVLAGVLIYTASRIGRGRSAVPA
jgi:FHS family glucose/mannose:H+ symporter-like MFS transporter